MKVISDAPPDPWIENNQKSTDERSAYCNLRIRAMACKVVAMFVNPFNCNPLSETGEYILKPHKSFDMWPDVPERCEEIEEKVAVISDERAVLEGYKCLKIKVRDFEPRLTKLRKILLEIEMARLNIAENHERNAFKDNQPSTHSLDSIECLERISATTRNRKALQRLHHFTPKRIGTISEYPYGKYDLEFTRLASKYIGSLVASVPLTQKFAIPAEFVFETTGVCPIPWLLITA